MSNQSVVIVHPHETESLATAIARALDAPVFDARQIATLNELLSRDPYLAEQLATLQTTWAITPPPAPSPLARLRRWLAWRLCGPELAQINATHATLTRIIESLVAHLDAERTARQVLGERIEALERS
jgi:hypothetical protein